MDLPLENGDFNHRYVSLPKGKNIKTHQKKYIKSKRSFSQVENWKTIHIPFFECGCVNTSKAFEDSLFFVQNPFGSLESLKKTSNKICGLFHQWYPHDIPMVNQDSHFASDNPKIFRTGFHIIPN